ncbi:MAG: hypothetical protein KDA78_04595 [Planctomycetaceae bacterium]|nr:hypothetical protein [Planctomycetaceae bacterium]
MHKPFEQRNQSDTARRKLKTLARDSGLEVSFVTALANFTWDYDPSRNFPKESTGWVKNIDLPPEAEDQLRWIADYLGVSAEKQFSQSETERQLLDALTEMSPRILWSRFLSAASSKNYGHVSEFASFHYLRGADQSRLKMLEWEKAPLGIMEITSELFCKFFRGGSIERYRLAYLWTDLTIPIQYHRSKTQASGDWINSLLDRIEALPERSGLKDLLNCCQGLMGGSKWFKQEILQALSYADVIRVNDLNVTKMFIPEHRNENSPHFYSNEWSYPLRFWSSNGGTVNRSAVPQIEPE